MYEDPSEGGANGLSFSSCARAGVRGARCRKGLGLGSRVCLSVFLFVCLSIYLFICLCVCLSGPGLGCRAKSEFRGADLRDGFRTPRCNFSITEVRSNSLILMVFRAGGGPNPRNHAQYRARERIRGAIPTLEKHCPASHLEHLPSQRHRYF